MPSNTPQPSEAEYGMDELVIKAKAFDAVANRDDTMPGDNLADVFARMQAENERLRAALHNVHGMCRLNESRHFIGTYVEEVLAVVK